MRHLDEDDMDHLHPLLIELRAIDGLRERRPGTFTRRSKPFLHFHADGSELLADVRLGEGWERHRATTRREMTALLRTVRSAVKDA